MVKLKSDVAGFENFPDLGLDHIARQTVFGNSEIQHAARYRRCFENGDGVTHQRQIVGGGKSDWPSSDDGDFERKFLFYRIGVDADMVLRFRSVPLGKKTLQRADGNRLVDLTAPAGSFAGMSADPAANARQRVGSTC